jgi:hypothetical protein
MQLSCSDSVQNQIGNFRLCVQVLLETYCIKCDILGYMIQHIIRELRHLFSLRSARGGLLCSRLSSAQVGQLVLCEILEKKKGPSFWKLL